MTEKRSLGQAALDQAEACLERGEYEDALGPAKEALAFYRKKDGDEDKAREALKLACSALVAGRDYEDGLKMAKEELENLKGAGKKAGQGEMLVILADLYLLMNQPKLATESATEAQEIFSALSDTKGELKALRALLYAYLARDKKKMALRVARQSLGLCQSTQDKEGEAASWNQLGVARMQSNRADEVPQALNEAVLIYQEVNDKVRQATTLTSLARFNLAKGIPEEALQMSEQARGLLQEKGQWALAADAWDVTVASYMALGKSETVLKKAKVELSAAKKQGSGEKIAAVEQRLIRMNLLMGDEEGAMHAAKRACVRMSDSGDWKGQASMLHVAAVLHLHCDRVELALRAAQEAIALLRANKGKEEHAREQAALAGVIAEAHTKRGEEPPKTASRAAALGALEELGKALEEKKVQDFADALRKLKKSGAYTVRDTKAVIDPIVAKDKSAAKFVQRHLPLAELLEKPPQGVKMSVTCLRKFECDPVGGVIDGVEWTQTMGKVMLKYVLQEDTKEDEIQVQLAGVQSQVTIKTKKFAPLTGFFAGNIVLIRSWWKLESEAIKRRGRGIDSAAKKQTLVICMAKAEHKAWKKLWYQSDMKHPAAKGHFPWTEQMAKENEQLDQETARLVPVQPGKPTDAEMDLETDPALEKGLFTQQSDKFMFAPDEVVVGVETSQDLKTITIQIVFDGEALKFVQQKISLESILACDVWEDRVAVFLRGDDQNPILCGQLWSTCTPHLSKWKMTTNDSYRHRQANFAVTVPILSITITKSEDAQCRWNKIFKSCWQHRLMIKNYDELEYMLEKIKEDETSGTMSYEERDEMTQRIAEWREDRFPGLPEAQRLPRRGNDSQEDDFYVNVRNTVEEITKRTGTTGKARWNEELGRYSYVY